MCKFYRFLYGLIPIKKFQSLIIQKHFSRCLRCRMENEIGDRLKELSALPAWVKEEKSFWPQIESRLFAQEKERARTKQKHEFSYRQKWLWATAGLALAAVIGVNLWIQKIFHEKEFAQEPSAGKEKARIIINYAEINGKKARPYVYQTQIASFIWFAEAKKSGG